MLEQLFSREFFRNHFVQWLFLLGLFLNALSFAALMFFFHPQTLPVLLRYNVYLGVDLQSLSAWYSVYQVPTAGLLFLVFHLFWAKNIFLKKDRVCAHLILLGGSFLQVGVLIATVSIILVNIGE